MDRWHRQVRKLSLQEDEAPDWSQFSEAERFAAVWDLSKQAWAFRDGSTDESRLSRDVASVIRRRR
jgi:hypothetical protein